MLNKKEIINNINTMWQWLPKYHRGHVFIVRAGAAMVLRGYRGTTNDIDICVNKYLFKELEKDYGPSRYDEEHNVKIIQLPGNIDLCCANNHKMITHDIIIPGIYVESEESLLETYKKLNREKDQQWIKILKDRALSI